MHGDERRGRLGVAVLVDVGHQRDLLEEGRELLLLREAKEVFGEGPQLLHVRPALLAVLGAVLQEALVSGELKDLVQRSGQLPTGDLRAQPRHELPEGREGFLLPARDRHDLAGLGERVAHADLTLAREGEERRARLVAQPAGRPVEHATQGERVLRVPEQPEVGEGVLHLATLIEGHAADHLVGEPEGAEGVLDRPGLGVGAVKHGDIARQVGLAFALETLDLARDDLGFV